MTGTLFGTAISADTISATTFYGDGSQLTGIGGGGSTSRDITYNTVSNYTAVTTDDVIIMNNFGNVSIPASVAIDGKVMTIISDSANVRTIIPESPSITINGAATWTLGAHYSCVTIICYDDNWFVYSTASGVGN